jgi:uncharacterized membrane protein YphA (DoxX/SURF4 family)
MTTAQARAAAAVRIATGLLFFAEGFAKAIGPFVRGGFAEDARDFAARSWPVWGRFLRGFVVPNATAVGWLIAAGELAVGIALVLGLLSRWACAGGILLLATFLLGQWYVPGKPWHEWITAGLTTKFALLLLLLLAVTDAGRAWGFDGRRRKR